MTRKVEYYIVESNQLFYNMMGLFRTYIFTHSRTYSDSTLPTVYSYDNAGRVASVLDESGRMDYAYGSMGEVTAETRTYALPFLATDLALTTQYEYDSWGRTTSITYPDGETVSYDYDRGGQLFRMYNAQLTMYNYLDSVLYDKFGAVTSRKYGNGLKMQYTYHPQNRRLTGITTLNGNSQLSHTAYSYDPAGNITQAVSSYPWLAGQTFTETFSYDSTNQLVSAANPQTYALSVTYGDWGKIQEYGLSQTDLASNTTTSQTRYYSYGSLNEGQTTFAPNNINYTDGTNVNEQYGINGSLSRRETATPGNAPSEELYRFGADGNLRMYSYDRLFYSLYGYDGGTTRTYKYSMDLSPNWVNGRLEAVNFNLHNAMFYPNAYINFNSNGYYTKHYYNGMERIASKLGDQNLPIHTHDPELQDRKEWQDSLMRKNVTEITCYQFLEPGQEQDPDNPKPVFELPVIGISNLQPSSDGIYYYHPNHLGSTCYVTDGNASVQQGFLYAPFGEITNEYNSSFGSSVLPKYSFNAKELDEETGMYYYEARYMAPPVFISRDPLFEKYPTFTPYAYCANNPIKYIDPTGEEIDISQIMNVPLFKNASEKLLHSLSKITGLQLYAEKKCEGIYFLNYRKDGNGKELVSNEKSSSIARNFLMAMIDNKKSVITLLMSVDDECGTDTKTDKVTLGIGQIENFINGVNGLLEKETMGYGMTFLHELKHTKLGGGLYDNITLTDKKGDVVKFMNTIRAELGVNYGQRMVYKAMNIEDGYEYLPFDARSYNDLISSRSPEGNFIKIPAVKKNHIK